MPITKEQQLALLSMDAYNRGYDAGLSDGGTNDTDGLGESGFVGSARILARPNGIDYQAWQDAGFYAVAYELTEAVGDMAAGTVIISYRGTDTYTELALSTLPIIAGDYDEDQIYLANQFYNSVKDANPNAPLTKLNGLFTPSTRFMLTLSIA